MKTQDKIIKRETKRKIAQKEVEKRKAEADDARREALSSADQPLLRTCSISHTEGHGTSLVHAS